MAVDVTAGIEIARPRGIVFAFAVQPDNAPLWYVNIKSVEWKSQPPLAVGSRIAFVAEFLGRRMAYTYEVTESVADARFVMKTHEGPFPMETTYEMFDAGQGTTRMTLRNRGNPSGFSMILAPFMAMAMRRANRKDLLKLKTVLESAPR